MINGMKKCGIWILLMVTLTGLSSWGFLVHKTVNQLAVYQLPEQMIPLYYTNIDQLVYDAPRADIRKNKDSTEATKHFIDLEAFGEDAVHRMPAGWAAAVKLYAKDSLLKYGYVPYLVVYIKERLTAAFRSQNKDSILFYSADLGHYIADSHVPLHTTINYDGQLTDQKGLHSLWESMIPELEIGTYDLYSKHKARYLKQPAAAIWKAIRNSNALLPDVLAREKEVTRQFTEAEKYRVQIKRGKEVKFYTTAFARAYALALKNTVNLQLISSANLLSDFWYTSWVDAGQPDLSGLATWNAEKQTAYKAELQLYQTNQLLKQNKLQAKQKDTKEAE